MLGSTGTCASTAARAAALPCPAHSCTNRGVGTRQPWVLGGGRAPLLMLARAPKYFHRTSNPNPGSPLGSQDALSSVKPTWQIPTIINPCWRGWVFRAECPGTGIGHYFHQLARLQQAKILSQVLCPCHRGLYGILLTASSQTGLESDCMNEHNAAVTGDQKGSQRMGR